MYSSGSWFMLHTCIVHMYSTDSWCMRSLGQMYSSDSWFMLYVCSYVQQVYAIYMYKCTAQLTAPTHGNYCNATFTCTCSIDRG